MEEIQLKINYYENLEGEMYVAVEIYNEVIDYDSFSICLENRIKGGISNIRVLVIYGKGNFTREYPSKTKEWVWKRLTNLYADRIETVPAYAFKNVPILKTIWLENVKEIGEHAFGNNNSLISVKIPRVNKIHNLTFVE